MDDFFYIVFGFAGQACHEIEFDFLPAREVCGFGGGEEVAVFGGFVDDIPESFGGGFHGYSQAWFSNGSDELGEEFELPVDPEARQ